MQTLFSLSIVLGGVKASHCSVAFYRPYIILRIADLADLAVRNIRHSGLSLWRILRKFDS